MSSEKTEKAKSQRSRFIVFGLCSLLALGLCIGIVVGVALSMVTEGVYEFETKPVQGEITLPETKDAIVSQLSNLLAGANDDKKVFVNKKTEVSVDESTIEFSGSKNEKSALIYMKNKIYESIDSIYPENYEGKFGDGYKAYPIITLAADECDVAECVQGLLDENGEIMLNEDLNPIDPDCFFFNVSVPGGSYPAVKGNNVYTTFSLEDSEGIAQTIKDELSTIITVDNAEIVPADFIIEAKADRLTGHILYANFLRNYKVSLVLTFTGEYADLGTRTLSFSYTVGEYYDYTWAGLTLGEDIVNIEKNDSHALAINAVMNDDSDYEISFKSSDEKVATIDELGYIYGISYSSEPVTITVNLKYLGQEYTASCLVYVTVPVEKIKVSQDEMSLGTGKTATLTAKLEPKNSTITDVMWISEDESVATVSSSGEITAVGAGKTTVIAVSADGYFRDSCAVTVTD